VHPPKTVTFDVPARVNTDTKGFQRPVDEYRETPFGLYMSRAMINRPTAHWVETWLLPDLGLAVTDWWWNPGHAREQDHYLDVCEIVRDGGRWVLTDHYLDIVVRTGRDATVVDVDEFVAAVALGLLAPAAAESAMHTAYRAVDGLASHGHDLDAWLATFGIALTWKDRANGDSAGAPERPA
jgi:predicted RNA-binding protein associated with RNAse of E/G family